MVKNIVIFFIFCCFYQRSVCQDKIFSDSLSQSKNIFSASSGKIHVRKIIIIGNRKTKGYIILREMIFKEGDSILISGLNTELDRSRQNIYNTTLFLEVKVEPLIINAFDLDVIITLKERWYIFPVPQFQLVDRSFNEWLVKYNGTLKRVNYGVKFVHYNLTGRNDQVKLYVINGYTRNISASYNAPYSNSKLTQGFAFGGGYSQAKELSYKINYDNSIAYYSNGGFVRDAWYIGGAYTIRKAIKKRGIFSLSYSHFKVADTIISRDYSPKYFNTNSASKGMVDLSYTFLYSDVNNILYPLKGSSGYFILQKRGLGYSGGINMVAVEGDYERYFSMGKKWYLSMQFKGKIKLPFDQPFLNERALGDGNNYIRGLEYYTIDGVAYALAKFNLKKELIKFSIPTFFKTKPYDKIPFQFFAKTFSDFGYAYNKYYPPTRLNNTFLYSGGFGIDILTLYDIQIRLEYSFNQLGHSQFFVHGSPGF